MDTHGLRLWFKHTTDALEDFVDVDWVGRKVDDTRLYLFKVKQVFHKAFNEDELTHHKIAVFDGLRDLILPKWQLLAQNHDDLVEEKYGG